MADSMALIELGAEERALLTGDLKELKTDARASLYDAVCRSLGLNPLTQPFAYITLNGKLTLYARKDATDQLRALHGVTVTITSRELVGDIYVVTARASLPNGRADEEIGAVAVKGLQGEGLANAYMKAITKAKRRATLSLIGLGFLDETEVETIRGAVQVEQSPPVQPRQLPAPPPDTNPVTGEITRPRTLTIHEPPPAATPASQEQYDAIISQAGELYAITGITIEVRDGMSSEAAEAELTSLKQKVADASFSAASVSVGITDEQRNKVAAAVSAFKHLGRPIDPPPASFSEAEVDQWLALKRQLMAELKANAAKDRALANVAAG